MISKTLRTVSARFALLVAEDDGMSTAEYSEAEFYSPGLGRRYPSQSDVNQRGASTHSPSSSRGGTSVQGCTPGPESSPATSPSRWGYLCWHDTVSG